MEIYPVANGAMGCGQKKLSVSVAVPPAPVRVPSQSPFALSATSVTSVANDKNLESKLMKFEHDDNESAHAQSL
jgi:hypothetical protein